MTYLEMIDQLQKEPNFVGFRPGMQGIVVQSKHAPHSSYVPYGPLFVEVTNYCGNYCEVSLNEEDLSADDWTIGAIVD